MLKRMILFSKELWRSRNQEGRRLPVLLLLIVVSAGVVLVAIYKGVEVWLTLMDGLERLPSLLSSAASLLTRFKQRIATMPGYLIFLALAISFALAAWAAVKLASTRESERAREAGRFFASKRAMKVAVLVISSISCTFLLTSRHSAGDLGSLNPRIGVVMLELSSDPTHREANYAMAVERARTATRDYVGNLRAKATKVRPDRALVDIDIEPIWVSSPSNAIAEIQEQVTKKRIGYVILSASPNDIRYDELMRAIGSDVITFMVRPTDLTEDAHRQSVSIYPSPESEGEWLAQAVLNERAKNVAVIQPRFPSHYEKRALAKLNEVLLHEAQMYPAYVDEYGSERELREALFRFFRRQDAPDFLLFVDEDADQRIAVSMLQSEGFVGTVGLTSRILEYLDPQELAELDFMIAVPWPLERYLALRLTQQAELERPERESVACAAAFSAALLVAHAHNAAPTLRRDTVRDYLLSMHGRELNVLLPLGSVFFHKSPIPPHSELRLKILRKVG